MGRIVGRWFPGVGARELVFSACSIGLASVVLLSTVAATRSVPATGLPRTTRPPPTASSLIPPASATMPPPSTVGPPPTTTAGQPGTTAPGATGHPPGNPPTPGGTATTGSSGGGGRVTTPPRTPPTTVAQTQTCRIEVRVIGGVPMRVRVCVNPPSVTILGPVATTTLPLPRNKAHGLTKQARAICYRLVDGGTRIQQPCNATPSPSPSASSSSAARSSATSSAGR